MGGAPGLLPLPHVQFWETENSGRLDRSRRGSHRRDVPYLVDATDLCIVNPLKPSQLKSMSAMAIPLQSTGIGQNALTL